VDARSPIATHMDFTLVDLESEERIVSVDAWNWRPTIAVVRSFGLIDDERIALMGFNGTEVALSQAEAREIGRRVREEVLPRLRDGDRLLLDLEVTQEPAGEFSEEELSSNYATTREWLEAFSEFCLTSRGFEVV
jgi:hypothetical protein